MRALAARVLLGALALEVSACAAVASGRPPVGTEGQAHVAALYAHRCARCHAAPEPGRHTRTDLEATFARHERRVRLTTEEWREMVDYLAAR